MAIANDIELRVRDLLNDTAGVRWVDAELLRWISDAEKEIVQLRPDANPSTITFTPATGQSRQALTTTGVHRLIDVPRNTHTNRAVRLISQRTLDSTDVDWHAASANSAGNVDYFVYDERNPKVFYIYPNASSTTRLEVIQSIVPSAITAMTGSLNIGDQFIPAITDYVCYRALSKDAEYAGGPQATAFQQSFYQSLGVQQSVNGAASPNVIENGQT